MSNELTRRPSFFTFSGTRIPMPDTRLKPVSASPNVSARPPINMARLPTEIDLIRRCAVTDTWYFSRCVLQNNAYVYARPVIPTDETRVIYEEGQQQSLQHVGEERCPYCGVIGSTIQCGTCSLVICPGRSTKTFFRCRKSCSGSGVIAREGFTSYGIAI